MTCSRATLALATLLLACGPADTNAPDASPLDSGSVSDAARDLEDAAPDLDGGARDATVAPDAPVAHDAGDAAALPFEAIAPCDAPGDYVSGSVVAAYDSNEYAPACLRVARGTSVTIEASPDHPLAPRTGGSAGNPIPSATSDATIRFDEPGFYPYLCVLHDTLGMIGVVQVVP